MLAPAARATQDLEAPHTMDPVVPHMLAQAARVHAVPVAPATMALVVRHTAGRAVPFIAVLVDLQMTDPEGQRIQGREDHVMRAPAVHAIQVPVGLAAGVQRFADEARAIPG